MKCPHGCGYEFKETEVVKYKCKVDVSGHAILKQMLVPGMVHWIPWEKWDFSVECPKCHKWVKLNGARRGNLETV